MTNMIFRRFPNISWAWPSGALDQLIRAAICPDQNLALKSLELWLSNHQVSEVGFAEQRLLVAIAHRFGRDISAFPQYGALIELQRRLWRQSSLAMAENTKILKLLAEAKIDAMLIKGGARVAVRPAEQIARVFYDLDIAVRPGRFADVTELMLDNGWEPLTGESRLRIAALSPSIRSLNFFRGHYGDVDLHQWVYGNALPVSESTRPHVELENGLWEGAKKSSMLGNPVYVPAPTDRLALAICHTALESHSHSDWLVDCAQLIAEFEICWDKLAKTLELAKADVPARIVFGYLSDGLGYDLPADFRSQLFGANKTGLSQQITQILLAKPKANWNLASRLGRGVIRQMNISRRGPEGDAAPIIRGRNTGRPRKTNATSARMDKREFLQSLDVTADKKVKFKLEIVVDYPGLPRRVDFEMDTGERHLVALKVRSYSRRSGQTILRFSGHLNLKTADRALWLEARATRPLRGSEAKKFTEQRRKLNFAVIAFSSV